MTIKLEDKINKIFIMLICLAPIFINLPSKKLFGEFGASLHNLLFPFVIFFVLKSKKERKEEKLSYSFLGITGVFLTLSIFINIVRGEEILFYQINVVEKTLRMYSYIVTGVFVYLYILKYCSKYLKYSLKIIYYSNYFLFFILLIELFFPKIINILNSGVANRAGIRLLTVEPSQTTAVLIFYFTMGCFYLFFEKKRGILFFFIFFIQIVFSSSKLFIVMGLINILIVLNIKIHNRFKKNKIIYTIVLILTTGFFFMANMPLIYKFINNLAIDMKKYTSFYTRVYSNKILLDTQIKNIFSVGGFYLKNYTEEIKYFLQNNSGNQFRELKTLAHTKTGESLVAKSGILSILQFYGLVSFIMFSYIFIIKNYIKIITLKMKGKITIFIIFSLNIVFIHLIVRVIENPIFFIFNGFLFILLKKIQNKKRRRKKYENLFVREQINWSS